MRTSYRWFWRFAFVVVAGLIWWTQIGRAWVRRTYYLPPPPPETARTADHFVAIVFPKITKRPMPYAFWQKDFEEILSGLKRLGYHTIGLEDARKLYEERRLLPPKSILIALDRDDPRSARLADQTLKKLNLRGVIFLKGGSARKGRYKRRWLSKQSVRQMKKGGAWEFGEEPASDPSQYFREFIYESKKGELRFAVAQTGFNDARQDPRGLNIMRVRPSRPLHENVYLIHKAQPRRLELVDKFDGQRLDSEWLVGWGAASASNRKLVILPMPGHTSAAVFLMGTEDWQDLVLEFTLERFKKNFWAYVRYQDSGRYLRVGIGNGAWMVQQKAGLGPPTVLGTLPMDESNLPATVRILLKGDWATLYINGAMQFGKALRVDPAIDRGRVHLGVYDREPRAAIAVLSQVRAKPLGTKWIALRAANLSSAAIQDTLRAELIEASVISPNWFKVREDGTIEATTQERETVWFQAGYYRCRLMPLLDVASSNLDFEQDKSAVQRLEAEIVEQVNLLGVDGLNLILSSAQVTKAAPFLERLRNSLNADKRELWLTWADNPDPAWFGKVDGVVKPVNELLKGLEILETSRFMRPAVFSKSNTEAVLWQ